MWHFVYYIWCAYSWKIAYVLCKRFPLKKKKKKNTGLYVKTQQEHWTLSGIYINTAFYFPKKLDIL